MVLSLIEKADINGNCWFIAVSSHNKIILDFIQKTNWKKPKSVEDYEKQEIEKNQPYYCKICSEIFTELDNEAEYKCKYHEDLSTVIYENNNTKETMKIEEAFEMINKGKAFESHFKHICCN